MSRVAVEPPVRMPGSAAFWTGCGLVLLAGLVLSVGAFAIRGATESDALQYLFWRAVGFTAAMGMTAWLRDRRSPVSQVAGLGGFGWLAAIAMAVSQMTFVSSVKISTFAETFFLCSLAPLIAAVLARPLLGERMGLLGLIALGMGLAGVYSMTGGEALRGELGTGGVLALVSALAFALYTLATRGSASGDRDAALIVVGVLTLAAAAAACHLRGLPLLASPTDAVIALLHGAFILSLGLFLFGQGSRTIPGVTFAMLAQAEAVISPIWGYFFFGENPTSGVLIGGALILTAVVLQSADGARQMLRSAS